MNKSQSEKFMRECLSLAHTAIQSGNYPLGSMVVRNGEILAASSSLLRESHDPTAHPEMTVIREACLKTFQAGLTS